MNITDNWSYFQISHSNLENFSSNVISKISAQVEQFEEATKMLLEKIDSKLLEISSEDRDSESKIYSTLSFCFPYNIFLNCRPWKNTKLAVRFETKDERLDWR